MANAKLIPLPPKLLQSLQRLLDDADEALKKIKKTCPEDFDWDLLLQLPECRNNVSNYTRNIMRFAPDYRTLIKGKYRQNGQRIDTRGARLFCDISVDTTLPAIKGYEGELTAAKACLEKIRAQVRIKK